MLRPALSPLQAPTFAFPWPSKSLIKWAEPRTTILHTKKPLTENIKKCYTIVWPLQFPTTNGSPDSNELAILQNKHLPGSEPPHQTFYLHPLMSRDRYIQGHISPGPGNCSAAGWFPSANIPSSPEKFKEQSPYSWSGRANQIEETFTMERHAFLDQNKQINQLATRIPCPCCLSKWNALSW